MPQQDNDAIKSKIMTAGREASQLLNHPMIAGFFKERAIDLFNQFCNLEIGKATFEDYVKIHAAMRATNDLKNTLAGFIQQAQWEMDRDRITEDYDEYP